MELLKKINIYGFNMCFISVTVYLAVEGNFIFPYDKF